MSLSTIRYKSHQVTSRPGVLINRLLDGENEVGSTLDFIDYRVLQTRHKAVGVMVGKPSVLGIIQGDERAPVLISDSTSQRGFAGLAWTDNGRDARVCQRPDDPGFSVPLYKSVTQPNALLFYHKWAVQLGMSFRPIRNDRPSISESARRWPVLSKQAPLPYAGEVRHRAPVRANPGSPPLRRTPATMARSRRPDAARVVGTRAINLV